MTRATDGLHWELGGFGPAAGTDSTVGSGLASLGPGRAQPAGDKGGAGQADLCEKGSNLFKLGWVQAVGEAGQVTEAVAGLENWRRVAVHPHSGVGGEGAVAAQQLQLLGVAKVEGDQPPSTGPLVPGRPSLSVGGQLPEPRSRPLDLGW